MTYCQGSGCWCVLCFATILFADVLSVFTAHGEGMFLFLAPGPHNWLVASFLCALDPRCLVWAVHVPPVLAARVLVCREKMPFIRVVVISRSVISILSVSVV